jgi:hypothetical protein
VTLRTVFLNSGPCPAVPDGETIARYSDMALVRHFAKKEARRSGLIVRELWVRGSGGRELSLASQAATSPIVPVIQK